MTTLEPQLPSQVQTALAQCVANLRLARATELAQSQHFLEAETLLSPNGELPKGPSELDLLARIAAQQRQFSRARKLWQQVLQKEPGNEAAREALEELESPRIALAFARRFAFLAGIVVLLSLSVIGLFALLSGFLRSKSPAPHGVSVSTTQPGARQEVPPVNEQSADLPAGRDESTSQTRNMQKFPPSLTTDSSTTPNPLIDPVSLQASLARLGQMQEEQALSFQTQLQLVQRNQTNLLLKQSLISERLASMALPLEVLATQQRDTQRLLDQTRNEIASLAQAQARVALPPTNSPVPRSVVSLNFRIKGVSVIPQQDHWVIRFDTGLFDRDDHFKIGSKALLESVAKTITQTQQKLKIEVIGFSENESPTWPWSIPVDRTAIARARAERVKNFFDRLGIFPASAVTAAVGSPEAQPFPGETRLNRTVILRISSR